MNDTAPRDPSPARWRRLAPPLLLLALCAAVFSNALPGEYVFDAKAIVEEHALLKPESPWTTLFVKTYWGDLSHGGLYRPLTMLTYRIEQQVLGFDRPWPHAAVNIALHAVVSILLWRLALQWTSSRVAALVAAALFAVHPVATEIVPNLVGRADLLASIGVLGGLLAWERVGASGDARRRAAWVAAAMLLWTLGLLSKESAVAFAPIAALRDVWRFRDAGFLAAVLAALRRSWAAYAAVTVVGVAYLSLYAWIMHEGPPRTTSLIDNPLVAQPVDVRVLTAVKVLGTAVRVCLLPVWLSADYSFDQIGLVLSPADPSYLAGLVVLVGLVTLAFYAWRAGSAAALGVVFFAFAYLPTSNLLFSVGTIFADRLLYLPLAGLCLVAGVGAAMLWRLTARAPEPDIARRAAVVLFAAVVVLLGARTLTRNPYWHDADTLFLRTTRDAPRSVRVHNILARMYAEREDTPENLDAAVRHAMESYRLVQGLPEWARSRQTIDFAATLLDRGVYLRAHGQAERGRAEILQAIALLHEAIRLRALGGPREEHVRRTERWRAERGMAPPEEAGSEVVVYANLGKAYYELGDWAAAAAALERSATLKPDELPVVNLWGRALANAGQLQQAEEVLRRVAEQDAANPSRWLDLARVQLAAGRPDAASASVDRAAAAGAALEALAPLREQISKARATKSEIP